MKNDSLAITALFKPAKILIYLYVNSGFSVLSRLVLPALGRFSWVVKAC
jgi:hypothetical protein